MSQTLLFSMAGESKLQRKIIMDLEKEGWDVLKISLCNKPGYPDLECKKKLRQIFYLEIKDEGKEAEPIQLHRHDKLRDMGFPVFVVDNYDEYLKIKRRL